MVNVNYGERIFLPSDMVFCVFIQDRKRRRMTGLMGSRILLILKLKV